MGDKEELERLKNEKARKDENERQQIFASLSRIENTQVEHSLLLNQGREEQKRTTKILFGDESDTKPGLVKRVDRLESKMKVVWGSVVTAVTAFVHSVLGIGK